MKQSGTGQRSKKYQSDTTAIRLVRNDLQALITASAEPTADVVPAAPEPAPVTTADPPFLFPIPLGPAVTVEPPPTHRRVIPLQRSNKTKPRTVNKPTQVEAGMTMKSPRPASRTITGR